MIQNAYEYFLRSLSGSFSLFFHKEMGGYDALKI